MSINIYLSIYNDLSLRRWANAGLMLGQCRRWWHGINLALVQLSLFVRVRGPCAWSECVVRVRGPCNMIMWAFSRKV